LNLMQHDGQGEQSIGYIIRLKRIKIT